MLLRATSNVHDLDQLEADAIEVARLLASAYANPRPREAPARLRKIAERLRRETIEGEGEGDQYARLRLVELVTLARRDTFPLRSLGRVVTNIHRLWATTIEREVRRMFPGRLPDDTEPLAKILMIDATDKRSSVNGTVARIAVALKLTDTAGPGAAARWTNATKQAGRRARAEREK